MPRRQQCAELTGCILCGQGQLQDVCRAVGTQAHRAVAHIDARDVLPVGAGSALAVDLAKGFPVLWIVASTNSIITTTTGEWYALCIVCCNKGAPTNTCAHMGRLQQSTIRGGALRSHFATGCCSCCKSTPHLDRRICAAAAAKAHRILTGVSVLQAV